MKFTNRTKMEADYEQAAFKDDRDGIVIVVKGTFQFPDCPNGKVKLSAEQLPLESEDLYSDFEPSECSDLVYESDLAGFKPKCDLVLVGSAHAPDNKPVKELSAMIKVGDWQKGVRVIGHRQWQKNALGLWSISSPEPFTRMPLDYQHTYGGYQQIHDSLEMFEQNPAGKGFVHDKSKVDLADMTIPNVFKLKPQENYTGLGQNCTPISFAPVSSLCPPRLQLAGTFDQAYMDERFPALPNDFNDLFTQIAPEDQQFDYFKGGETIELFHLTPEGYTAFQIPEQHPAIWVYRKSSDGELLEPNLDTVYIESDKRRFILNWRVRIPFVKNIHEIEEIIIGKQSRAWQIARQKNKSYYASLADLPRKRHRL